MRYILFGGCYYDSEIGGWNDLQGDDEGYLTLEDAMRDIRSFWDWWHIVDIQSLEIVATDEEVV